MDTTAEPARARRPGWSMVERIELREQGAQLGVPADQARIRGRVRARSGPITASARQSDPTDDDVAPGADILKQDTGRGAARADRGRTGLSGRGEGPPPPTSGATYPASTRSMSIPLSTASEL